MCCCFAVHTPFILECHNCFVVKVAVSAYMENTPFLFSSGMLPFILHWRCLYSPPFVISILLQASIHKSPLCRYIPGMGCLCERALDAWLGLPCLKSQPKGSPVGLLQLLWGYLFVLVCFLSQRPVWH